MDQAKKLIRKLIPWLVLGLIVAHFLVVFLLIEKKQYNPDEFVNTHVVWSMVQGKSLYKEILHLQGPVFPVISAAVWKAFDLPENMTTIKVFRYFQVVPFAFILIIIFLLSANVLPRVTGYMAVIFGMFTPTILIKAVEYRPDMLAALVFFSGLLWFLKYFKEDFPKAKWSALFWGFSILINLKALLSVALVYLLIPFSFRIKIRDYFILVLISLLPVIVVGSITVFFLGSFEALLRPLPFVVQAVFFGKHYIPPVPIWMIVSGISSFFIANNALLLYFLPFGIVKVAFSKNRLFNFIVLLGISSLVFEVFLRWYLQYFVFLLPLLGIVASAGALHYREIYKQSSLLKKYFFLGIVLIVLFIQLSSNFMLYYEYISKNNESQIRRANIVLSETKNDSKFFYVWDSMNGAYIFRHHLLYSWARPIKGVQKLSGDLIGVDDFYGSYLIRKLKEAKSTVLLITEPELDYFPPTTRSYIRNNYFQRFEGVWYQKNS